MKRLAIGLSVSLLAALRGFAQSSPEPSDPIHSVPAFIQAQEAPSPCRPLFSTSAGITETNVLELEFGGQKLAQRDGSQSLLFPTQFNLGVASWVDLRLGWSAHNRLQGVDGSRAEGFGDPQIGTQIRFLPQQACGVDLGLAYWHKFSLASAHKGIGTGASDDSAVLVLTRTSGNWVFDVNVGANWVGRADDARGGRVRQPVGSFCATWLVASGWNVTLDTYAIGATELSPTVISSILAVSRRISRDLTLDIAVESGLNQAAPRLGLNAGLVWRMGRIK
ncbi:MAG TPA: transporter [Holophaga sp.]|jgi:hypothetical protein|nr:transporter [Holophaga sp.]